jgi:hypothetical protein
MRGKLLQFDEALRHEIVSRLASYTLGYVSILTLILKVDVLIRDVSK